MSFTPEGVPEPSGIERLIEGMEATAPKKTTVTPALAGVLPLGEGSIGTHLQQLAMSLTSGEVAELPTNGYEETEESGQEAADALLAAMGQGAT